MKKIFVFIVVSLFILEGCATNKAEDATSYNSISTAIDEIEQIDAINDVLFEVTITTNENEKLIIQNPESGNKMTDIILRDLDLSSEKEDLYYADLSFLGFDKDVKISAFAIDYITQLSSCYAHIRYSGKGKMDQLGAMEKDVPGNCLVIAVEDEGKYYIIVLDYLNQKSYVVETSLTGSWPDLIIADITGDGMKDIIISNVSVDDGKQGTMCEIYRFNIDGLKKIYSNIDGDANYFSGHLADNYKVVIESERIGYKKKVSLLDLGYRKKDLEIDELFLNKKEPDLREDIYDGATYLYRCYQNGKIQKDVLIRDVYFTASLDNEGGIQYYTNSNMKAGLKFKYGVYMGKWSPLGSVYAYMKYNELKDVVEPVAASFVSVNTY